MIEGDGFRLRPPSEEDIGFLVTLAARPEVADYLSPVSPWTGEEIRAAISYEGDDPLAGGRFVLEVEEDGGWRQVGGMACATANSRSRIVHLYGVMIAPEKRGQGLAERATRLLSLHLIRGLGYHRIQLEVYGFNARGQRLFERAGFVREGVRRKAYWRHGAWQDGIHYGLVEEDL